VFHDQEVVEVSFPQSVYAALRAMCFERAAILRGASAMLVGVAMASGGLVAFAAPAEQAATATATPGASCVPPPQGVVVTIDAPNPGAVLSPDSNVVVTGVAYDAASTSGPGVDRVTVFLGDRDAGGIFWGEAMLGQPSPQLGGNLTTAGYSRRSPSIPTGSGGRDIFVYARSSATGREVGTSVPVFLGAAPTAVPGQVPTAAPAPLPVCTPIPSAPPTVPPTATPVPVATQPPTAPTATVALPATPLTLPPTAAPVTLSPAATPAAAALPATATPSAALPTQTTAPRGGGVPVALGLLVVAAGAGIVGGGVALRRRERRGTSRK
jgi:hypothetical protein